MFVYNYSVKKFPGEDMDINNFQNIGTIGIYILINREIVLNLAQPQYFHQFLILAWTQDLTQGNLESQLTIYFLKKFLNLDWHWYFKSTNLESCWMGLIVQLGPRSKQSISFKVWTKDKHKSYCQHPPPPPPTTVNFLTSSRHSRRLKLGIQLSQTNPNPNFKKEKNPNKSLFKIWRISW